MSEDVERMQAASGPSTQYSPSFHLAALASAAAESRVGHGNDDDDDDLLHHLAEGSSSESTILKHLRSTLARPVDSSDEARPGRTVSREAEGPTELAWQGKRLVWSRGCQVIRSYSYQEAVVHACWSWLDRYGPRLSPSSTSHSGTSYPRRRQSSDDSHELFSPSQRAFVAELNGGPAEESHRFPPPRNGVERALIVVLQTAIIVYYPRLGEEYTLPKSFRLQRALPTMLGVVFQRTAEDQDWRRLRDQEASESSTPREARLPTLFYFEHHFSEVIPIALVEKLLWPRDRTAAAYGATQDFRNLDEHIVFASSDLPGFSGLTKQRLSIIVTSDIRASKVRIYAFSAACERWKGRLPPDLLSEPSAQSSAREADSEARGATSNGRPSLLRLDSWSGRGPTATLPRRSTRLSSASTPAREQGTTRQTPMTRRRSSKFPSAADKSNINMARIDESFTGPANINGMAGGPLTTVPVQSERIDDAAEAEEMGQIVEGLAGRASKGSVSAAENSRAGDSRRTSGSVVKQKRNSQMARTPYIPRTHARVTSASLSRRRSSKSVPLEGDVDHHSIYGHTSAKPLLSEDADIEQNLEAKTSALDDDVGLEDAFARRPALQLLAVIADVSLAHSSEANVFITSAEEDVSILLYISTPKQLLCRRVDLIASGDVSHLKCTDVGGPESAASSRAISIAATGAQQKDMLSVDGEGHLELRVGSSDHLKSIPLHFDESAHRILLWTPEHSVRRLRVLHLLGDPPRSGVVSLICGGGRTFEAQLAFAPVDATVQAILMALEIAVEDGLSYRRAWVTHMLGSPEASEWDALSDLFLQKGVENTGSGQKASAWMSLLAEEGGASVAIPLPASGALTVQSRCEGSPSQISSVLATLNAVAQDIRLDVALPPTAINQLGTLIFHLAVCHGASLLADYWASFIASESLRQTHHQLSLTVVASHRPQDVLDQALAAVSGRFATKQAFLQSFWPDKSHLASDRFLPRIAKLFDALTTSALSSHDGKATDGWLGHIFTELSTLPWSVTAVLRHNLRAISRHPPAGLSLAAYRLMGREDVAKLSSGSVQERHAYYPAESLRSLPTTVKLDPLSAMIFPADRRLQDVAEMLVTSRPTVIRAPVRADKTDAENRESGIIRLSNVAERIKATQVGRGMFLLLTKRFDATQKWFTPRINLRIHLKPAQSYGFAEPRHDSPELEWPDFHNGAASALEMVVDQGKVDSTWYFSQSQGERSARHAGLLLGLGLAGRFATIGQVHTYRYLGDRHNLTSIGLLLGLSATFVAQGDPDVRALLACHVKAFLPPQSANLAHSTLVQSAALLGTGLLFLGADVSHIAEALCDQIGAQVIETTDAQTFCREAYSLSAALGLGLVMLGRGRRHGMKAARDRRILSKLEQLIVGPVEELFGEMLSDPTWRVDLRITASPAAVAYALLFLRSNDEVAASKIPLPSSPAELDKHRPDVLLVHSLARNLIMWNAMTPSQKWLQSVVPQFLQRTSKQSKASWHTLALINIETGALFALSLKHAGSADLATKKLLLEKYHEWTRIAKSLAKSDYEDRILQAAAQASAAVAATGLSMVLAGTGDIDVLKLLRMNHGFSPAHEPYGHHMATHMALGVLLLGGGRFTLGNSDAAVAALLIAFYPRMPTKATDNRAHLQAYRHMWMLAVEPRLVTTRDVDSAEVAQVPITITRKDGSTYQATTPHQLPHLNRVKAVSINSDRYWSSQIVLDETSDQAAILKKARAFSVKRKAGYLSHAADPKGQRSIMNASLAKESDEVGVEVAGAFTSPTKVLSQMAEGSAISRELARLLRLLPHQQDARDLSKYLPEALMACLQRGHQNDLPLYLSVYQCYNAASLRDVRPADLQDCLWLARFASQAALTSASGEDDAGDILPNSLLLTARQGLQRLVRASLRQGEVRASLCTYLCSCEGASLYDACSQDLALVHEAHNVLSILSPLPLGEMRELVTLMRAMFASLVPSVQALPETVGGGGDDVDAAFEAVRSVGQRAVSEMLQKRYGSWVRDAEWAEVDEALLRLVILA